MNLRPFFTYFGAKWRIAPYYPIPKLQTLVEPFAGAAGYSLRYSDHDVILYDKNPKIVATWNYLISADESDILGIPNVSNEWNTVDDLDIPLGAKYLLGWWLNKGNTSPAKSPSAWLRSGKYGGASFWGDAVKDRIVSQLPYIRHWRVWESSYENVSNRYATWFIDPPYQVAGKSYSFSSIDYSELGFWCRERNGQVIVCENSGSTWLPFVHLLDAHGMQGKDRTGRSSEAVWTK